MHYPVRRIRFCRIKSTALDFNFFVILGRAAGQTTETPAIASESDNVEHRAYCADPLPCGELYAPQNEGRAVCAISQQ